MGFTLLDHLSTPIVYLTQSLWRDEAFSFVLAKHSFFEIVKLTGGDFNPPLYYFVLHFWINIFGSGEVTIRSLSLIFHLLTCYVAYKLISKTLDNKAGTLACLGVLLNPILFYYGFEARMYSMLAFLSLLSIYLIYDKKWGWWIVINILGIYTHSFFWLTILSEGLFFLFFRKKEINLFIKRLVIVLVSYIFWLPSFLSQIARGNQGFWIGKINSVTVTSSLGNIFTSYEGTPGGLWGITFVLSLLILMIAFLVWRKKRSDFVRLMIIWLFIPLLVVFSVSVFKPIFVNRYVIFTSLPIIFLIVTFISVYKKLWRVFSLMFLAFEVFVLLYLGPYLRKVDIRESVRQIEMQMTNEDVLVSRSPLTYFESTYYSGFTSYLYSQTGQVPSYLGSVLIPKNKILPNLVGFPGKVILLNDDGSFETVMSKE